MIENILLVPCNLKKKQINLCNFHRILSTCEENTLKKIKMYFISLEKHQQKK